MDISLIEKTLTGLKKRLSDKSTLTVQGPNGYVRECKFSFNPGATEKQLEEFIQYSNWQIPTALITFFRLHNGGDYYEDECGTYFHFLSLSEIMQYHTDYMPDHYYAIAIFMGSILIVDSDAVTRGDKNYLYWFEAGEFYKINVGFDLLFDRWIIAQGEPYWTWDWFIK